MKFYRVQALLLRYLYIYPRSVPRILDIVVWPLVDILIWGFLTIYLQIERPNFPLSIFLGALIFWDFILRAQQAVTISFMEEIWERNLFNIFVTPIKLSEFLFATFLVGVVRIILIGISLGAASLLFFHFNIFSFGLYLVPFILNFFIFGWILGLLATAILLRFGQSAQVIAFAFTTFLQPFLAVFYPVSVLPKFIQPIALAIPATHVFEGMRSVVLTNTFPLYHSIMAIVLNGIWFFVSVLLLYKMFGYVRREGRLLKLVD